MKIPWTAWAMKVKLGSKVQLINYKILCLNFLIKTVPELLTKLLWFSWFTITNNFEVNELLLFSNELYTNEIFMYIYSWFIVGQNPYTLPKKKYFHLDNSSKYGIGIIGTDLGNSRLYVSINAVISNKSFRTDNSNKDTKRCINWNHSIHSRKKNNYSYISKNLTA